MSQLQGSRVKNSQGRETAAQTNKTVIGSSNAVKGSLVDFRPWQGRTALPAER